MPSPPFLVATSEADGLILDATGLGTTNPSGNSLIDLPTTASLEIYCTLRIFMSRDDPLAPLLEEIEKERRKKQISSRIAKISLAWFMILLMIGWVSKYAYRLV